MKALTMNKMNSAELAEATFLFHEAGGMYAEARDALVAQCFLKAVNEFAGVCRKHGFRQIRIPCLPPASGALDKYRPGRNEMRAGRVIQELKKAGYEIIEHTEHVIKHYAGLHWEDEPISRFSATLLLSDVDDDSERAKAEKLAHEIILGLVHQIEGDGYQATVDIKPEMPPPGQLINNRILATVYGHDRKDFDEPFNSQKAYLFAGGQDFHRAVVCALKRECAERWGRHPDAIWHVSDTQLEARFYPEGITCFRRSELTQHNWQGLEHVKSKSCWTC